MDNLNSDQDSAEHYAKSPEKDVGIPKMNVKFDGHTWTNQTVAQHKMQDNNPETQPSTSGTSVGKDVFLESTENAGHCSPASSTSNDETDGEFELTADAMVHDFDDETTLDEEESKDEDTDSEELDDLAKEGGMPLTELLALYRKRNEDQDNRDDKDSSPENPDSPPSTEADETNRDETNGSGDRNRKLRSSISFLSPPRVDVGDENEGGDYNLHAPEDGKKTPRVGEEYQVSTIPDFESQVPDYDVTAGELRWDPCQLSREEVEDYLSRVGRISSNSNMLTMPTGSHLRDNEDALSLLCRCNHNVDEAVRRYQWQAPPLSNELHSWSEEECRQFEFGLSVYGKDFNAIHHNKVKTKSIGEIVKFYYIWKKTERFDHFHAKTRLSRKKDTFHPGVTDYMDKLLDETELSGQHHNAGNARMTSYPPPHSHSAALQQYLHGLRTVRTNPLQATYRGDSLASDYLGVNGLLDGDYADEIEMFDNILPTLPVSNSGINVHHAFRTVPFETVAQTSYDGPTIFTSASTISHPHDVVSVGSTAANRNNNSHVGVATRIMSDGAIAPGAENRGFRPVEPADITPALTSSSAEVTRTTPIPSEFSTRSCLS